MQRMFANFASRCAYWMGHPLAFILATAGCVVWAISGPFFHFSDTWQLVINTATTVLTFLAVFLIQNSQNRDGAAIQTKLDEMLRAIADARTVNFRIAEAPVNTDIYRAWGLKFTVMPWPDVDQGNCFELQLVIYR